MLIPLLYTIVFIQIGRSFMDEGIYIYKDPKIWAHLIALSIITSLFVMN